MVKSIGNSKGKVIIFDDDEEWGNAVKEYLRRNRIASNIIKCNFKRCFHFADKGTYDIAIINVHILTDAKKQLAEFRKKYPAVITILTETQHDPEVGELFWYPPVADYRFGEKRYIEIAKLVKLIESIRKEASGNIKIILPTNIDEIITLYTESWTGGRRMQQNVSLEAIKRDLAIVIRKLFLDISIQEDHPIASEIKVEQFDESGKSTSCMFKIIPKIIVSEKPFQFEKSAVLKFGPKNETRMESNNYNKFVEWFLDYDQTVQKIGYEEGNNFGGILYSYLIKSISFAEYMRTKELDKCLSIIQKMFNVNNKHWLAIDGNKYVKNEDTFFQTYYLNKVLHSSLIEMA